MLRKVSRALGGKKESVRVRIDVTITELANLPAQAKSCRIVWARDAKLQITRLSTVQEGTMGPNLDIVYFVFKMGTGSLCGFCFQCRQSYLVWRVEHYIEFRSFIQWKICEKGSTGCLLLILLLLLSWLGPEFFSSLKSTRSYVMYNFVALCSLRNSSFGFRCPIVIIGMRLLGNVKLIWQSMWIPSSIR